MARRTLSFLAGAAAVSAALAAGGTRPAFAQGGEGDAEAARARQAAHVTVASMESAAARARLVLRGARVTHDAQAAACADEALTRADVALRLGRDNESRAAAAWEKGDRERARFEMSRLTAHGEMARVAARDADACVARHSVDPLTPNDVTIVRVSVDPSLPADVAGYP
jgi:hypothetical protein